MGLSRRALSASLLLHAILLLALVYYLKTHLLHGISHVQPIEAYLSQLPQPVHNKIADKAVATRAVSAPATITLSSAAQPKTTDSAAPAVIESVAPAPAVVQQLLLLIATQIQQHLVYPNLAQIHVEQGQSLLQFDLTPQGELENIKIVQSSGIPSLDQAALQAIQASSPIQIPATLKIETNLTLRLPVHFQLSN